MNIFALSQNPKKAAKYHSDKHVVKMILESAQLLSTAHHLHPSNYSQKYLGNMYKKTHENHPCAIWARTNTGNYKWLLQLLHALIQEYTYRYNKSHQTWRVAQYLNLIPDIPEGKRTDFVMAMPDEYKVENTVHAYRRYYTMDPEKARINKWNKTRRPPYWYLLKSSIGYLQ